jgi:hypothetical protein
VTEEGRTGGQRRAGQGRGREPAGLGVGGGPDRRAEVDWTGRPAEAGRAEAMGRRQMGLPGQWDRHGDDGGLGWRTEAGRSDGGRLAGQAAGGRKRAVQTLQWDEEEVAGQTEAGPGRAEALGRRPGCPPEDSARSGGP